MGREIMVNCQRRGWFGVVGELERGMNFESLNFESMNILIFELIEFTIENGQRDN
jgi:hypothetical protein